jgi:hypothetical protein
MPKDVWDKVGPWPNVWKIGSQFSCRANGFGYNFIVPLPDVVHPMDYKPSYNKNHLRNTYLKGKPEWKMV